MKKELLMQHIEDMSGFLWMGSFRLSHNNSWLLWQLRAQDSKETESLHINLTQLFCSAINCPWKKKKKSQNFIHKEPRNLTYVF